MKYPATLKCDQTDFLHGTRVADPYRWLEGDVREHADVAKWVQEQNELSDSYLQGIAERETIANRLRALWNYPRYGLPVKKGGRYFFEYNTGLLNQNQIHVQDDLHSDPVLLLDPNTLAEDGTIAVASWYPSPDGRYLAVLLQDGGTDWRMARILDTRCGEFLDDTLHWLKFTGLAWHPAGRGFYYSRYPAPSSSETFQSLNTNHALYFHAVGEPQEQDRCIYSRPDHPDWGYAAEVSDDERYLLITVWKGTDSRFQLVLQDLKDPSSQPTMLVEGFEHDFSLAGSRGSELFFRTTFKAPRGRLIAIDPNRPDRSEWREVIAETSNVLTAVSCVADKLVVQYMQDARSLVSIHELNGGFVSNIELPGIGSAVGFAGDAEATETFYSYSSFATPATVFRFDVGSRRSSVFKRPSVDFDSDDYVVQQRFVTSADGTQVPMFVAHRKDTELDGANPTVLYGYGGFNIAVTPEFSIARLVWMEMGGVWAVANIRGGGEYGEDWHKAGTGLQKQNVFDDFIAAAEALIDLKYTSPDKLAVFGGSNGGLLVGAVTNQRPELFAAAMPAVGVMDMLRFHHFTAGRFWVDDYGSPDDPEMFPVLLRYSPYHNLRPGTDYPAVLITTADTDDRVVPAHSFKYAAALQAAQAGDKPILIRVETRAGHGAGTPTDKVIAEYADRWGFLLRVLDFRLPQQFVTAAGDSATAGL